MRADRAIGALEGLKAEAATPDVMSGGEHLTAWKAKVRGVLVAALGGDDDLVQKLDTVRYKLSAWSNSTPSYRFEQARHGGIRDACGVIDAAIYRLRLESDDEEPVDHRSFDPELWEHVKRLVEDQDWGKVASQTAIFVEDRVRTWAGDPKTGRGDSLVGKELMGRVFADESEWRLGSRAAEREGWRALATGFAQALGNVDRHRIQLREDARRYAIGVLGLGSLLLTQARHEHGDLVEAFQTSRRMTDLLWGG